MGYFNNYIVPSFFTLFLHVMVLVAVLIGWQMSDTKRYRVETPRYVKAKLITMEQQKSRKVLVERTLPPEPVKEKEPPKIKRVEPRPVKKPVKTVAPRNKPSSQKVVQSRPEPVAKPKAVAVPKVDPKRAEIEKRQAEQKQAEVRRAEVKRVEAKRAEAQRQEQARLQRQEELQLAMAEEEMMMQAEDDEEAVASYVALIKQRLVETWSRPPSARKNMQVVLSIRLIPTGEVVGVEVVTSSGNLAFDRSAIIAVEKAERFPAIKEMPGSLFETYFRRFNLVFTPEDLLL